MREKSENLPSSRELLLIVFLNLLPVGGVLLWDWQAFDIIFLYWMENLVIGAFSALRMIARPYRHPIDLIFPLFLTPFFVVHYGAFCWGHGTFVMSMFGQSGTASTDLVAAVMAMGEPIAGLLLLIALKTASDVYHWRKAAFHSDTDQPFELTEEKPI